MLVMGEREVALGALSLASRLNRAEGDKEEIKNLLLCHGAWWTASCRGRGGGSVLPQAEREEWNNINPFQMSKKMKKWMTTTR